MMEFTYEGIVRHGFGFYNPNHAAALICALMPFVWLAGCRWRHWAVRVAAVVVTLVLCIALAMTFSRTGFMVVLLEAFLFCLAYNRSRRLLPSASTGAVRSAPSSSKRMHWQVCLVFIGVCAIIFYFSGGLSRFTLDKAVTNRLDIWKAGVALFASNPWRGVGLGNSGLLATSYLLRDGIVCRTLVNSHLTLLVEFGAVAGIVWTAMIVLSFCSWKRYPACFASFAGLCISAFSASIFDWEMLFDFDAFGSLPLSNFVLSWCLLLLFGVLMLRLSSGSWRLQRVLGAVAASVVLIGLLGAFGGTGPKVSGNCILIGDADDRSAVIRGPSFTIKDIAIFMQEHGYESYILPIEPLGLCCEERVKGCRRGVLFGNAHELEALMPDLPLVYVSPPEWADIPERTEKIFLKRYADSLPTASDISEIPVVYY